MSEPFIKDGSPRRLRLWAGGTSAVIATYLSFQDWRLGAGMSAIMLLIVTIRNEIRMDPETRRFRLLSGFYPFVTVVEGSFDELHGIEIEWVPFGEDENRFAIRIVPKSRNRHRWKLFEAPDLASVSKEAAKISDQLQLPILEGVELGKKRDQFGSHYQVLPPKS